MNSDYKGVRRSRRINQFVQQLIKQIDSIESDMHDLQKSAEIAVSEGDASRAIIHYENAFRLLSIISRLRETMDFYGV